MATKKRMLPSSENSEIVRVLSAEEAKKWQRGSFVTPDTTPIENEEKKGAGFWRTAGDFGIKATQGAVDLGSGIVGLTSLASGGLTGKAMRGIGYDPQRTNEILGEYLSDAQKEADNKVASADGFVDSAATMLSEPRALMGSMTRSLPSMVGGLAVTRALATRIGMTAAMGTAEGLAARNTVLQAGGNTAQAAEAALSTQAGGKAAQVAIESAGSKLIASSAAAEGAQTAGKLADDAQADGREYNDYALPSLGAGMGTAGIGFGAGKLMGDSATRLVTGANSTGIKGSFGTRVAKDMFSEGVLEEMPQSAQEQYMTNIAMGEQDRMKGVGNAAGSGLVAGAAMGGLMGGAQNLSHPHVSQEELALDASRVTESGALSRAANAGIDAQINQVRSTHNGLNDLVNSVENNNNPSLVRQAAQQQVVDDLAVSDVFGDGPRNFNELLQNNIAEVEQEKKAQHEYMQSIADDNQIARAERAEAMPLEKAQFLNMQSNEQGANTVLVPHLSGEGYTIIPSQWLTENDRKQFAPLQNMPNAVEQPTTILNDENTPLTSYEQSSPNGVPPAQPKISRDTSSSIVDPEKLAIDIADTDTRVMTQEQKNIEVKRNALLDGVLSSAEAAGKSRARIADLYKKALQNNGYKTPTISDTEFNRIDKFSNLSRTVLADEAVAQDKANLKGQAASSNLSELVPEKTQGTVETNSIVKPLPKKWIEAAKKAKDASEFWKELNAAKIPVENRQPLMDAFKVFKKANAGNSDQVFNSQGKPFTTKIGAITKQKSLGDNYEVAPVDGGYVVQAVGAKSASPISKSENANENKVMPGDIQHAKGFPFKTKVAANNAQKINGGEVVAVEGGYVVRPFVEDDAKPTYKKGKTGAETMRNKLAAENPFLSFLATNGINIKDRSDVGGEQRKARLIAGHGPLFRKNGLRLDELAQMAHEQGFLTKAQMDNESDNGGVNALSEMIGRALNNEVVKVNQDESSNVDMVMLQDAQEVGIDITGKTADEVYDLLKAHYDQQEDIRLTEEIAQINAMLSDINLSNLDSLNNFYLNEIILEIEGNKNAETSNAPREAQDSEPISIREGQTSASSQGTNEDAAIQESGTTASGNEEAFKLEAETVAQAKARTDKEAEKAELDRIAAAKEADRIKQEQIKKEIQSRQAASAENFQLGQSAEDSLSGQGDIFSQPENKTQEKADNTYPIAAIAPDRLTIHEPVAVDGWKMVGGGKTISGFASENSAKIALNQNSQWKNLDATIVSYRYNDGAYSSTTVTRYAILVKDKNFDVNNSSNDRDTISFERATKSGDVETVTLRRGDYVSAFINKDKSSNGEITGISLANQQVKVNDAWFDVKSVYSADRPNEIEELNNAEENDTRSESPTSSTTESGTSEAISSNSSTPETSTEQAQASDGSGRNQGFRLTSETEQEARDRIAQQEREAQARTEDEARLAAAERNSRVEREVVSRQDASAENFQLGQSAEDSLSGQGDIFAQPAATSVIESKNDNPIPIENTKTKENTPKPTKKDDSIGDFGEHLIGAKKDLWQSYQKSMTLALPTSGKDITLSKHFPEPNYESLIDAGIDVRVLAAVKAMRDEIPAKPRRPIAVRMWGDIVRVLHGFAGNLLSGKINLEDVLSEMRKGKFIEFANRIEIYAALGYPAFTQAANYSVSSDESSAFLYKNGRYQGAFNTQKEAIDAMRSAIEKESGQDKKVKSVSLDIYQYKKDGNIVIGKKVASGKFIDLKGGFATFSEARAYLDGNKPDLMELLAKKKEVSPERRDTNNSRVGADIRNGIDVTPEKFDTEFGFRGVQFGNYVEQGRRTEDLNNSFDALHDMAAMLGIPNKAVSLNGTLGLAFGARGSGGKGAAMAHFEPNEVVINLTKSKGAGSLGHEWFHALDNYFARAAGLGNANDAHITSQSRSMKADSGVRIEVINAYKDLMKAINSTQLIERSKQLDKRKAKDYWSTEHELSARAFEAYLIDKASKDNASNDYLANIFDEDTYKDDPYPYPTKEEQKTINPAFDKLFSVIKSKETDDGVALYSRSPSSEQKELPATIEVDGVDRPTTNSNGKPLATTEEGVKNFWRWFGDSSVVDADGKPLVAYHGTKNSFNEFRKDNIGSAGGSTFGSGFYFTDSQKIASFYAEDNIVEGDAANVLPAYVSIVSPLMVNGVKEYRQFIDSEKQRLSINPVARDRLLSKSDEDLIIDAGYDGVIATYNNHITDIVAFNPTQIKSATGNNGKFDENNPDIRHSLTSNINLKRSTDEYRFGIPNEILEEFVSDITKSWKNAPKINIVEYTSELPFKAPSNVRGAYYNGQVYLVASRIGSVSEAQMVLFHEALGHAGLRELFGDGIAPALRSIGMKNRNIAVDAAKWRKENADIRGQKTDDQFLTLSIEEVLADMAGEGKEISNFTKLANYLQGALRKIGLDSVADWLEGRTNAEVLNVLDNAKKRIEKGNDLSYFGEPEAQLFSISNSKRLRDHVSTVDTESGGVKEIFYSRGSSSVAEISDILRSASTLSEATTAVRSILDPNSHFGIWDRTVGTQFNKAKKDADFKKVFDASQQQIDDVAHFAIESERLAPSILRRLDSARDNIKAVFSSDNVHQVNLKAVSNALFANIAGKKGVQQKVFTDKELVSDFNLTPKQIEMYREARLSVDASLDRLSQSIIASMGRTAGMDIASLKNASLTKTADAVIEFVGEGDVADRISDLQEYVSELKSKGYMPAMRFGEHTVLVQDPITNETLYFTMHESAIAANLDYLRTKKLYPTMTVEKGRLNKDAFAMFKGVSPETVELFAKFTGTDQDKAFQDYIALAKSQRSSMKRMLERDGVEGFSKDLDRVLASFITSNARQTSLNANAHLVTEALSSKALAKKGDVQYQAQKLVEYLQNPQEEAQKIRGYMFLHYIGGSLASAMVNLTQPILQTTPFLSQYAGKKTLGIMTSSAKMAAGGRIINVELFNAFKRASSDGLTEPHEIHNLMADATGSTLGTSVRARAAVKLWGSMFSVAESFNRKITFLAAYQTAQNMTAQELKSAGFDNAYDFSKNAIIETQGLYSKANRPNWARGSVGATLFTFKQFSISYVEFFNRLPRNQKMLAFAILVVAAGIQGLPFADDIEDLIDTIGQSMGYNTNSKKALRLKMRELFGETAGAILTHGISTESGFDLHGRLGMSNLLPGTAMFKPSEDDSSREILEVAGALGGILKSFKASVKKLQQGDILGGQGAVMQLAPGAIKNAAQGVEMASSGYYKDQRGRNVEEVSVVDAALKAIGLQPQHIADNSRKRQDEIQDISMVKLTQANISDDWAHAIARGDKEGAEEARQTMLKWNEKNPESRIRIDMTAIRRRVLEIKKTANERMIRMTPKTLKSSVQKELT